MGLRRKDLEQVIAVARDASQGGTFRERIEALYGHLAPAVPFTHATAGVFDRTTLTIPDPRHLFSQNHEPEHLAAYATRYSAIDKAFPYGMAHPNEPVPYSRFYPDAAFGRDEFSDFLARSRTRYGVGCGVPMPSGITLVLCVHRESGRDFSKRELDALSLVYPEIGRAAFAAVLADRIAGAEPDSQGGEGVLVLDERGDLVHATARGLELIRSVRGGADAIVRAARSLDARTWTLARRLAAPNGSVRAVFVRAERQIVVLLTWTALDRFEAVARRAGLTPREKDVARLAVKGLSNRAIAGALALSPITVKLHLSHVFRKVGVATRTQLAAKVLGPG